MASNKILITSMNVEYYIKTGYKMLESVLKNWPEIEIWIGTEDSSLKDIIWQDFGISVFVFDLGLNYFDFYMRNRNRSDQQNSKELHLGAVRFAPKSFTIIETSDVEYYDFMIWLDADTVTHTPIPEEFLDGLCKTDCLASYLGRSDNYSECGFVVYNLKHPRARDFFNSWEQYYLDDSIFTLPQWHDSFIFDTLRKKFEAEGVKFHNITPWGRGYDHVFINSDLGLYMDHMKGGRKEIGKSKASDFIDGRMPQSEYWSTISK